MRETVQIKHLHCQKRVNQFEFVNSIFQTFDVILSLYLSIFCSKCLSPSVNLDFLFCSLNCTSILKCNLLLDSDHRLFLGYIDIFSLKLFSKRAHISNDFNFYVCGWLIVSQFKFYLYLLIARRIDLIDNYHFVTYFWLNNLIKIQISHSDKFNPMNFMIHYVCQTI